jgi:predicted dinucleotide-binding enzyme
VVFGSRDPASEKVKALLNNAGPHAQAATCQEAIVDADAILLATPWPSTEWILRSLGDLSGKVLIDCINPLNETFSGLTHGFTTSGAELIASWTPGAHVVKAFNSVSARVMADANFDGHPATLFYCGDDTAAKRVVHQLAADIGFDPVDAGPLLNARYLEPLAMLYIHLAIRSGWGSNTAFRVLKREAK